MPPLKFFADDIRNSSVENRPPPFETSRFSGWSTVI